jgi:hypothetical protein
VTTAEAGGSPTRASSSSPPGRAAQAWRHRAADDPEARWGWLKRHPRWDEIELRLRHRWTPRDVERWLRTQHPDAKTVSYQTLYRYREDKDEAWYVSPLVVGAELRRGVARLMVLQEHTALIEALKVRIRGALTLEATMDGLLIPEVRTQPGAARAPTRPAPKTPTAARARAGGARGGPRGRLHDRRW